MRVRFENMSVPLRVQLSAVVSLIAMVGIVVAGIMYLGQAVRADIAAKTREHVETAESVVAHFGEMERSGKLTRAAAQELARNAVKAMRYAGQEYFFITDMANVMIMNPVKQELEGKSVAEFKDPGGFRLFIAMTDAVRSSGGGFIYYLWPKAGAANGSVSKIAYVKGFAPWGWVIGSGVYTDDVDQSVRSTTWELGTVAGLFGLVAISLAVLIGRSISKPMQRLAARMRALGEGDTASPIPFVDRTNEFGEMARALGHFRDAALSRHELERKAEEGRSAADQARESADHERRLVSDRQADMARHVADGLSRLASGDLTSRLDGEFSGEMSGVKSDFDEAIGGLQSTMSTVRQSTDRIRDSAGEVSQAAADLSRRTEQQAAALEETAASLQEISGFVGRSADGAEQARKVASGAKSNAERSGEIVEQAIHAMGEIEQSSVQISQIIGVIDEIAFQTNLLALNAGVEAARAGETGRGFAVVASEVRALAQRSAEAAREIKTLIQSSSRQVEGGAGLVREAGVVLASIAGEVTQLHGLVVDLAESARQQSTGIAEVNAAISQMDQVTQQNAAMVEQSTAASQALAQDAERLVTLLGQFNVGEEPARPKAPIRKPASAVRLPARQQPRAIVSTRGGAAAALRETPRAEEASWEEF